MTTDIALAEANLNGINTNTMFVMIQSMFSDIANTSCTIILANP